MQITFWRATRRECLELARAHFQGHAGMRVGLVRLVDKLGAGGVAPKPAKSLRYRPGIWHFIRNEVP